MGCTKCKQEKLNKEIRYNEIINPYLNQNKNTFKSVSILDELNNKIKNDNYNSYNVYNKKEIIEDEEARQLDELTKKIKANKRLLKILKKCQSIIIGIQVRKKIRYDKLRRAKSISLDNLLKKEIPLQKFQIENFFKENPPKINEPNLRIIRSEPVIFEKNIIYIGEWEMNFFQRYGRGKMIKRKEKVNLYIPPEINIQANGIIIKDMEKVNIYQEKVKNMKDIGKTINLMEKGKKYQKMEMYILALFQKEKKMEKVCYK